MRLTDWRWLRDDRHDMWIGALTSSSRQETILVAAHSDLY